MAEFKTKIVLSDIEGTTTSISFVKDILFPYAKKHCKDFLNDTWNDPNTETVVHDLTQLPQYKMYQSEAAVAPQKVVTVDEIASFVNYLIDRDLKVGPLKTLQGLVWAKGYAEGTLKGHVYKDVPSAFKRWQDAGIRIVIYSSGSVKAQQLLFGQTELGNLLPHIVAHYDTAIGHKQEMLSYVRIAKDLAVDSKDILFLTDIVKEAEAARLADMQTAILKRPGNAPLTDDDKTAFVIVDDFDSLKLNSK